MRLEDSDSLEFSQNLVIFRRHTIYKKNPNCMTSGDACHKMQLGVCLKTIANQTAKHFPEML